MNKNLLGLMLLAFLAVSCEKVKDPIQEEFLFAKVKSFSIEASYLPEEESRTLSLKNARVTKTNLASQLVKQRKHEIELNENQDVTLVKRYQYDNTGNLSTEYNHYTFQYNNIYKLGNQQYYRKGERVSTITYKYNADFSLLIERETNDNGSIIKEEFLDYDSKGRYGTIKEYRKSTNALISTSKFKYDDRNFITENIIEYSFGGDIDTIAYSYKYDNKGNVIHYTSLQGPYKDEQTNTFDLDNKTDNVYRTLFSDKLGIIEILQNGFEQSFGLEYYLQQVKSIYKNLKDDTEEGAEFKLTYSFDENKNLKTMNVYIISAGQEAEYAKFEITDLVLY